jgi:asparagine synthase (glutamine-hydrolysing)
VRESLVRLTSGEGAFVRDALDRMGEAAGVELRHPFLDRRVIEFLIVLPEDLRWRHGIHRYLLRQTFGAVLPDVVRTRLDKPDIDHVVIDGLRAIDPAAWLDHLEVVARGWVRDDVVRDLWQRTDHAGRVPQPGGLAAPLALWNIFALEAWVRGVFSTSNHVAAIRRTPPLPL